MKKYTERDLVTMPQEEFKRVVKEMEEAGDLFTSQYMHDPDKEYDFKAPKGFEDRWSISDILRKNLSEDLTQCPTCKVYHNDPEHYCGSVALVRWDPNYPESPTFWRWLLFVNFNE